MKRLLALSVVLASLAVCAPSYGYILVYKVTGAMKAVEWNSDKIISVSVKGYLAISINGSNEADDAQIVIYGKNASGDLVYFRDTLNSGSDIIWNTPGSVVAIDVWNWHKAPFYYDFTLTGKVKAIDVGLGAGNNKLAAGSLKGTFVCWEWYQLLDGSQELYGSGTSSMTLDSKQTKAANQGTLSVSTVISDFIDVLIDNHYNQIIL
jgi:hypothetical protein